MSDNILKSVICVGGAGAAVFGMLPGDATAQTIEGFYGGLSYGASVSSDVENGSVPSNYSFEFGGAGSGIFAGYNMAIGGNWFVGAELSYMSGLELDESEDGSSSDLYGFADVEDIVDARIRLGQTFDRLAVYTAFGVSWADAPNMAPGGKGGTNISTYGLNIGVGMEYLLNDRFFLGGEIIHRRLQAADGRNGEQFPGADSTAISIRAGFRF